MRKRQFLVIIERDEDGILVGNVPSLRGCHTQAKTLPALISRIKEVIHLCIESERSPVKPMEFVGLQEVEIS